MSLCSFVSFWKAKNSTETKALAKCRYKTCTSDFLPTHNIIVNDHLRF
jgi:hypothetical protein